MVPGLFLKISWACLLLFGSCDCVPFTKEHYVYPYKLDWLHFGSSAKDQQTGNPPQQPSAPTGIQSSSSLEAHSVDAEGHQSHHANRWTVTSDVSSDQSSAAPHVLSQSAGYTGSAVQLQLVSSGNAGSSPEHDALSPMSHSDHTVGYMFSHFRYSGGQDLYVHNPAASGSGYTLFYASPPAAFGFVHQPVHPYAWFICKPAYHVTSAAPEFGHASPQYYNAPVAPGFWAGPHATYPGALVAPRPSHRPPPLTWWFWDGHSHDYVPAEPRFESTAGSPSGDEQLAEEAEALANPLPGVGDSEGPQSETSPPPAVFIHHRAGKSFPPRVPSTSLSLWHR
ncbi:hypothetical protein EXN66_Car019772 [Channa argus]|uniref:Uncharacterized protein n=1 Tax=Channa argus TaxID=215402 RepID=A0A6G1QNM8_CHAAH|nr:hypothetical protein EXN66_Car019772 [Channa argus]